MKLWKLQGRDSTEVTAASVILIIFASSLIPRCVTRVTYAVIDLPKMIGHLTKKIIGVKKYMLLHNTVYIS